jgi:hypothetical protein
MKGMVLGTLFCALWSTALWAQDTAQINGTVTDASGAVLPGVEVTAAQTATGLNRSVVTNETGAYTLANLPIGPYRLEAVLPGFRTFSQTGIVLQVGANPVINIALQVGQVSEIIEVQADAALVETRSTGVGQVIDKGHGIALRGSITYLDEQPPAAPSASAPEVGRYDRAWEYWRQIIPVN